MSTISLRLLDFKVTNQRSAHSSKWSDNKEFVIQMFGLDEAGKSYSLFVKKFNPFFYIKVGDDWNIKTKGRFLTQIQLELSKQELTANYHKWKKKGTKISPAPQEEETVRMYVRRCADKYTSTYHKSITECKIIKRHTLYGFDANREYKFIILRFKNTIAMNKVKNLWYDVSHQRGTWRKRYVLKTYNFHNTATELYEARLPPLLRYFHIQNISPSGWITIDKKRLIYIPSNRKTTCDYEYIVPHKYIRPIPNKETPVPIKICSFDIECSSSHGDFPVAQKSYTKFVRDVITYWGEHRKEITRMTRPKQEALLVRLLLTAFGYDTISGIHTLYPKQPITQKTLLERFQPFLQEKMYKIIVENKRRQKVRNQRAKRWGSRDDDDEDEDSLNNGDLWPNYINKSATFLDYLNDPKKDIAKKMEILDEALSYVPRARFNVADIEGDTVTFIGSTFMTMGQSQPFLNHGVCLGSCQDVPMANSRSEIVCCKTEKDLLLEWTAVIRREQPDVIIGYNIFGFDWKFLCERAEENHCFRPDCPSWMCDGDDDEDEHGKPTWFSLLSKNKGVYCRKMEKEIRIASGTHLLTYVQIDGMIQIDLYNYFRREVNLPSYKLQDVASHFIGDIVTTVQTQTKSDGGGEITTIHSGNLMGLQVGNYVIFEVIDHSTDLYQHGQKFEVTSLDEANATFTIKGEVVIEKGKKLRWGLGKDDVTPQDLFQAFSDTGTIEDRTKIARYCFQDCNLVHHLMRKNDILTGMSEIASICSIPIDFVVMRGQGIKLLSFIAQQCRKKNTLMPNIDKVENDGSYEGAICLQPKKNFYTEDPIAVVDYASLYPSSMISENISHDSKVWTKEYDLQGNLILETGNQEYDNLPEYEYVDIEYDTYEWISPDGKKKEVKVKVGTKICRFAQFPDNKKAIMPSIAQELLAARKATRILIKYKTLTTTDGQTYTGLLHVKDDIHQIRDAAGKTHHIPSKEVKDIQDTYNDFMKNVFDKRQLGFKITANSLYGQCGARTSAFYEKDIAASTTATGRKLLLYAQRIIEEVYQDRVCETSLGTVMTKADCIYGDSVTSDTPILLKHIHTGQICFKQIDNIGQEWLPYEGFKIGDKGRFEKEQCMIENYKVWTSNGWANIRRLIRHKTNKKLYRITTHTGMVDVTEDHSLLDNNHQILKPKEAKIGIHLLHHYPIFEKKDISLQNLLSYIATFGHQPIEEKKAFIYGFFYGDGSCGKYNCPSGRKHSWALNNKDIELCIILQSILEEIYNHPFKVLDTIKSSGVYKIVPVGNVKKYVEKYRPLFYNKDRYKQVPACILNAGYKIQYAYFAGYYAADGNKCMTQQSKNIGMSNKGKIGSAGLFYLAKSLGLNVSINTRKDKLNIINIKCSSHNYRKHPHELKKVEYICNSNNEFVYDIETETGDFNTGFPLIVKNTDSCFFTFNLADLEGKKIRGKQALMMTIELAQEAGVLATKMLKLPHDLEYEKTFWPFLLLSKKRYVGMQYEHNPNKCKRKSMGIVLKRRDNAPIVKDIYGGNIDILMKERDIQKAMKFTQTFLDQIVKGNVDMRKLIISKALRGFYKNPTSIAHKVLADRMGDRDPGNKPAVGSRIPYIYIQTKTKQKLQGNRIEHPDYIRKHNLKPDYSIYITNQIMKPLVQIFALVLEKIPQFKSRLPAFKRRLRCLRRKYKNQAEKLDKEETKLRNAAAKKLVFGQALRRADNAKTGQKTIDSFF